MQRRKFLVGTAAVCGCSTIPVSAKEAEEAHTCTIIPSQDILATRAFAVDEWPDFNNQEGAVLRRSRWNPSKREFRVAFLTYHQLAERVFNAAKGWESYMPLRFRRVGLNDQPDAIVGFVPGAGHWSYVGTDSGYYARRGRQTMNYGWRSYPSQTSIQRVALHEFGHAMGLIHEQSSPGASIDWNRPAVYAHYQRTQGWTPEQTERNVLARYSESQVNRTEYDPKSIMHYPVRGELVNDSNDVVGWNSSLSQADKAMAAWLWQ